MFRKIPFLSAAFVATIAPLSASRAGSLPEFALGPTLSTTGLGLEVSTPLIANRLNLNVGFTAFAFSTNIKVDGTNYDAKVKLGAIPVLLTFYPFANWFNIQAGAYFNRNQISVFAVAPAGMSIRAFGQTFTSAELGSVSGHTHFNTLAPYVGIGFGQPFRVAGSPLPAALASCSQARPV